MFFANFIISICYIYKKIIFEFSIRKTNKQMNTNNNNNNPIRPNLNYNYTYRLSPNNNNNKKHQQQSFNNPNCITKPHSTTYITSTKPLY